MKTGTVMDVMKSRIIDIFQNQKQDEEEYCLSRGEIFHEETRGWETDSGKD